MGHGERRPPGERGAPAEGGAATLPGVGAPAGEPASAFGSTAETAATAGPSLDAAYAGTRPAAVATGNAETLAAGSPEARAEVESAETLSADDQLHGATLQGPYTVADLPTLPRVDDASYAIGHEIARGGMGKILAARDRRLRREVVIKVMRRESGRIDPRFEREALITARLQHPSIVRVYDAGVLGDGRAFYAMERVRGRSLEVVLTEAKTLRDRLALLPHAIAVCDALAYAHNEGVVHRDLKPSNVLIGPFGETVVIDWGLAKDLNAVEPELDGSALEPRKRRADSSLTQHGAVMGTPAYMAPEQARGEPADERTDIFALGALLYTLFTGRPPHRGSSSDEVIDAVVAGRRMAIVDAEPELPAELVTIVEHAMAHEPAARYASAKALADELRAFAAGKLVASHDYSSWQLIRRWIARHRVPVAIGAVATVLLALTGVIAVRNVLHERDRAHAAQRREAKARYAAETAKDRFVLEQATSSLATDPSRAAGWLKQLSDEALGWPEVHAFAATLPAEGVSHELAGHRGDIEVVVVSPDRTHAATASDDSTVRWWDLARGGSVELPGHSGPIDAMALSGDGRFLASAGTDHTVMLWDLTTLTSRKLVGHSNTVRGVAFSPDHARLGSTSEDGSAWLWDVATGTGIELVRYSHSLRPVVWFDNATLLVGAFDGALGRIDVATNRTIWKPVHKAELRTMALTRDRKTIVLGDEDGRVTQWTADGSRRIRELARLDDVVRDLIITPDDAHVISAGGDHEVYVHTLADGTKRVLAGNGSGVKDIDLSADGTLVASAGIDGNVRVWKLDGTLLHTFRGHRSAVKAVGFAGDRLVSSSDDDAVRVWPLSPPPPPPHGPGLRAWLAQHTNVTIAAPTATP